LALIDSNDERLDKGNSACFTGRLDGERPRIPESSNAVTSTSNMPISGITPTTLTGVRLGSSIRPALPARSKLNDPAENSESGS
jgi:hypothetical protein